MTHIPRPRIPLGWKLVLSFLLALAIILFSAVSLIRNPPKGPDEGQCVSVGCPK